jgi:hypothetical protein
VLRLHTIGITFARIAGQEHCHSHTHRHHSLWLGVRLSNSHASSRGCSCIGFVLPDPSYPFASVCIPCHHECFLAHGRFSQTIHAIMPCSAPGTISTEFVNPIIGSMLNIGIIGIAATRHHTIHSQNHDPIYSFISCSAIVIHHPNNPWPSSSPLLAFLHHSISFAFVWLCCSIAVLSLSLLPLAYVMPQIVCCRDNIHHQSKRVCVHS